jgi:hypothetical protein
VYAFDAQNLIGDKGESSADCTMLPFEMVGTSARPAGNSTGRLHQYCGQVEGAVIVVFCA